MAAKAVQAGNEQYAQGYKPPPFMFEPTKNPAKKAAVITCLDSRLDPQAFLGAELGEYHIIRNAGGRINDDVIDNLVVSQQLLGTREVFVVHHTRCGMLAFNSKDFNEKLKSAGMDVGDKDWREFSEGLEQSVKEDVAALKASPLIPDDIVVHGYIYHIEDGKLESLDC